MLGWDDKAECSRCLDISGNCWMQWLTDVTRRNTVFPYRNKSMYPQLIAAGWKG